MSFGQELLQLRVLSLELAQALAEKSLLAMHEPVRYRAVESDGAALAARRIAQVLDNRWWVQR